MKIRGNIKYREMYIDAFFSRLSSTRKKNVRVVFHVERTANMERYQYRNGDYFFSIFATAPEGVNVENIKLLREDDTRLTFRGFIELPQDKFEELVVLAEQVNAAHAAAKKAKREMDKIKRQLNKKKSEWNRLSLEANAIHEIS